jgi:TRAP-type mannitol/chloroaromatic compound transport system substrate-binding protein
MKFFKEKGVKTIKLDPQEIKKLQALFKQVLDERAEKDPFYKKILDSKRNFHESWKEYEILQRFE